MNIEAVKARLAQFPNKLPTVMEYTYLLNDYAELEKITTEQARSVVGSWTCEQWLEYYKVAE